MKYFLPLGQQVAGRDEIVEAANKAGRRTFAVARNTAGHLAQCGVIGRTILAGSGGRSGKRVHQMNGRGLPFALEHAIDRPLGVFEKFLGRERRTVTADHDPRPRQNLFREFGEIEDFRNVRQIIAGKPDDVRLPGFDQANVSRVILGLQVDDPHVMAGFSHGLGHQLQTKWLET